MIRLQELELVFGHMPDAQRTHNGWTDRRDVGNSILDISPGQFWVLQFSSSLVRPEQVPPFFSDTDLDLVLYFVPPPQVLVQVENVPQSRHSQFTETNIISISGCPTKHKHLCFFWILSYVFHAKKQYVKYN